MLHNTTVASRATDRPAGREQTAKKRLSIHIASSTTASRAGLGANVGFAAGSSMNNLLVSTTGGASVATTSAAIGAALASSHAAMPCIAGHGAVAFSSPSEMNCSYPDIW